MRKLCKRWSEERSRAKEWRLVTVGVVAVLIILAGALAIWNFYHCRPFEPSCMERMVYPLPNKPSIIVLPFINMSGDFEQAYLAGGVTENIITALSRNPRMFVIARNSMFTYEEK